MSKLQLSLHQKVAGSWEVELMKQPHCVVREAGKAGVGERRTYKEA